MLEKLAFVCSLLTVVLILFCFFMISYRVLVAVDHKLRGALEVYETLFDLEQKPMTKYD